MGRRKERRLAAISAAGRRVKLDLFAEPSGNSDGSSAQDAVGEASDSRTHAELSNSPSTSGQQLHNPLLLLEQYSDEDLDECVSDGHDDAIDKDPSDDFDEKKISGGITTEDIGTDDVIDPSFQTAEQLEMDNDSASQNPSKKHGEEDIKSNNSDYLFGGTMPMEEGGTCRAAAGEQVIGDVSLIWKKVLHEESNQYYYWNTITGKTSWEVPDVLAQATVLNCTEKAIDKYATTGNGHSNPNYKTSSNSTKEVEAVGIDERCIGDSLYNERGIADSSLNHQISLPSDALVINGGHSGEHKSEIDLSSLLVKHCETLLERLNALKSLNCNVRWQEFKLKSMLEVEIRLSDVKTLASHGSAMFPFWLHTKDQLKRLDAAVDDAIQHDGSASTDGCEATFERQAGIFMSNEKEASCSEVKFHDPDGTSVKSNFEACCDVSTTTGFVPSVAYPTTRSNDDTEENDEIVALEMQAELVSKHMYHSREEVDMDVDMEIDSSMSLKSPSGEASGAQYHVLLEKSHLHNPPANQEQFMLGQIFSVQPPAKSLIPLPSLDNEQFPPPPPDNDPYPPPPPDEYPFPPPPPDEPPGDLHPPPPHLEPVHTFHYQQQYMLPYPPSNLEYYGQLNTEISDTTLYVNPEGVQVAPSHLPPYYEAGPNIYAVAPLVVNPGNPSTYYSLLNGNLNPISLVGGAAVESTTMQNETVLQNRDTDTICSFDSHAEAGTNLLSRDNLNVVKPVPGPVKEPEVLNSQPSVKAQSTASTTHGVIASSVSDASTSVSATATTLKAQSKVPRGKKQTVSVLSTLRSNKKVSSLVDKWKAAKEEMREEEEEEEPENAYEMLERKRRREIEEWQAQQITSGGAKDNANFQPLGGDWRERVRRKRALKMKETEHESSKLTRQEEPNLVELSRDLPSGWQAYWDDSSKQVYYGNVVTSETTWIRPKDD